MLLASVWSAITTLIFTDSHFKFILYCHTQVSLSLQLDFWFKLANMTGPSNTHASFS